MHTLKDGVNSMGQERQPSFLMIALLALLFFLGGCKLEETLLPTDATGNDAISGDGSVVATGSGSGITAPIISDPLSGSTISDRQPTLTVLNSAQSESESRTYLFQVSADTAFAALEAQSTQVPEGPNGSTSWELERTLAQGRHFWRVRSRSGTNDSQFSATAEFSIASGGGSGSPPNNPSPGPNPPPPPAAGTIVSDPLIGGSIGQVAGGQFTSGGWQVTAPGNFIRYEVPPMVSGWVEFDISGLREINSSPNQFMLFGMWDPSAGSYRANPFRVHLQKLHPNPHNPPYLRLRWITNGEQHDEGNNFLDWNPSRTYRWRIEWGPSGGGHTARVFLDGQLMITVNYNRAYRPNMLFIELGIGERGESVVGAKYSNLQIGN